MSAAEAPRRRRAWRRPLLVALGALLLALVIAEAVGWPFLRSPLQRAAASSLQRPVELGPEFRLRLLGRLRLRSNLVELGSPAGAPVLHDRDGQPQRFLRAEGVTLVLPYSTLWALLRGHRDEPLRVRRLEVTQLDLALARDADGRANWQFGEPPQPSEAEPKLPQFDRLVVHGGRLRLDDTPMRLVLDATLRTREGSSAAAGGADGDGGLELTAVGRYRDAPLQGRLRSSGVLPLAAAAGGDGAATVPLQLELAAGKTRLTLDGRGSDLLDPRALDAQLTLEGPSLSAVGTLAGLALPDTPPFALRGRLRKNAAVWNVGVDSLSVGSSRLHGEFTYDPQPAVPTLSGRLGGKRLALADLGQALGGSDAKPAPATPGRVLPQREFSLPALAKMNADLAIKLDQVSLGSEQLDTLAPLSGRLRLHDRVLSVDDLFAGASGGELRGALSLDARQPQPRWRADLRWSGVRLEQFILARSAAKKNSKKKGGDRGSAPAYIGGALGGRAQLRGEGRSTAAMLGSLDGAVELWLRDGRLSALLTELAGIDLAESLGVALSGDKPLPVRCGVARLVLKQGIVAPEVAVIDTADSTLGVTGIASLRDERLDLVLTSRPHDFSPLALRSPVRIEGSFAKPQIDLDASRIGLRVAAAAALAAVAPLAGLLALGDLGEEERGVCGEALQRLHSSEPGATAKRRAEPRKTAR